MRKNILILSHSDAMQFLESCNQYASVFDPKLYHVTVAYLTGEPNETARLATNAETILFLNLPKASVRGLKLQAIYKLYRLCHRNNYAMIICHRYKPMYLVLWVARFISVPRILFVMHAINTMSSPLRQFLVQKLFQKNMYFIGVSAATCADMRKCLMKLPEENFTYFPNLLDYDAYIKLLQPRAVAQEFFAMNPQQFNIVNIGRFVVEKDHGTLLKALALVVKVYPQVKLYLLGDGKLQASIEQQILQLNLKDSVVVSGFVHDAYQYLPGFDLFVLSSIEEAFGRVLLEAMGARLPIIATKVDGIPEVMGDTNLLVPAQNPQLLAEAILKVIAMSASERAALAAAGYQRLLSHFSYQSFYQQFWAANFTKV